MLISKTNSNTSKKPTTKNLKVTSLILTNLGKEESEKKQIFKIDQEESNDTENNQVTMEEEYMSSSDEETPS